MRFHRFYVSEKIGSQTELKIDSVELSNQIQNVFRLKIGDKIIIFDGSGFDYDCEIKKTDKNSLCLKVIRSEVSSYMPNRDVYLYQSIVKKDNFEWIVEKATELGVTHIVPVISERSEKKSLNEERLKKIAIEASEQSGRGDVPAISPIMKLEEVVSTRQGLVENNIVFHTKSSTKLNFVEMNSSVAVFIGPEGGWSEKEIELFHNNNFIITCLGNQVLRSETAVIAALSQIVFGS